MSSSDPRPLMFRSFDQAIQVVSGISADQLQLPTPCSEYDVAALLTHLVGAAGRIASIARGEPQTNELPVHEGLEDSGWSAALEASRDDAQSAWADDEVLDRKFEMPWGTFTGSVIAGMYAMELTVHTWDLASATGQVKALDGELAESCLPIATNVLPPEPRGGFIPFGPVVPVPDDAPAYRRLAAYLGRSVE